MEWHFITIKYTFAADNRRMPTRWSAYYLSTIYTKNLAGLRQNPGKQPFPYYLPGFDQEPIKKRKLIINGWHVSLQRLHFRVSFAGGSCAAKIPFKGKYRWL